MTKFEIKGKMEDRFDSILTKDANDFLTSLHENFNQRRLDLLDNRLKNQEKIDKEQSLDLLEETKEIRNSNWKIKNTPEDLQRRWVEITGPPNRRMTINALNSGADVFMADFEDANSPTWYNCIEGQISMYDAFRKNISYFDKARNKSYELRSDGKISLLVVRPRGWHLNEKNILINGQITSGSLVDFGLAFFHNAKQTLKNGSGPYYYLPKMESYLECRLWNDVFVFAQKALGIPVGTIKSTVLIETIPAAFQMEEFLFELKDHIVGLNAGRWDYMFSCTKRFKKAAPIFPERDYLHMTVPFMRAYTERIVMSTHKRGAHAMGGMAAFVPNRKNPEITKNALKIVRQDKKREAADGFDGSWVAHPDLVEICREEFDNVLKGADNQVSRQRPEVEKSYPVKKLIDFNVPDGKITEGGFQYNVEVGLLYLTSWFMGNGATALHNKMEDVATAEISRTLIWQWIQKKAKLDDGTLVTAEYYHKIADKIAKEFSDKYPDNLSEFNKARNIMDSLVVSEDFEEFLSVPAYEVLE